MAVEAVGLANMVLVLGAVVRTLVELWANNYFAGPNLGLLVMKNFDPQNTAHGILMALDVMTFWVLGARSIALARLANISVVKAGACVFGIWVAYTGFFIALSVVAKAISGAAGAA
jgi:hypothetical protein